MAKAWGGAEGLLQRSSSPAMFLDPRCLIMGDVRASSSFSWASVSSPSNRMSSEI